MKHRFFYVLTFCFIAIKANAQQIKPYDLIQIYKYSQINEDKFGKSVYHYLNTVDTGWKLTIKPILTDNDAIADYSYTKTGHSWYMPETYHLMVKRTYGPPLQHTVMYGFKELDLWTSYLGQMTLMNAVKLGSVVQDGATRTMFTLNGIAFVMVDFPPGVQGPDRTFEVMIITQNNH